MKQAYVHHPNPQESERLFALRVDCDQPQLPFPLTVRDYLLFERDGARICLVRFDRHEAVSVDAVTLALTMLDAGGAEIERRTVTLRHSDLPTGEAEAALYAAGGMPVDARCTEVIPEIREVIAGDYRYRAVGGAIALDYVPVAPWRYDPEAGRSAGLSDTVPLRVRSVRSRRVRGLWPVAAVGFLLLLAILLWPLFSEILGGYDDGYYLMSAMAALPKLL